MPGQKYTFRFRARANDRRKILCGVQWSPYSRAWDDSEQYARLSDEWASYTYTFTARKTYGSAFITVGRPSGQIEISDLAVIGAPDPLWLIGWFLRDFLAIPILLLAACFGPLSCFCFGFDRRISVRVLIAFGATSVGVTYIYWRISVINIQIIWLALPLLICELLSIWQIIGLQITLAWAALQSRVDQNIIGKQLCSNSRQHPPVFALIPTVDEGIGILEPTVRAMLEARKCYCQNYADTYIEIIICNDGHVKGFAGWQEVEEMATFLGIRCITRTSPGGAKAGNVEYARKLAGATGESLVVILDADQIVAPEFLLEVLPPFRDPYVAWVQTPQWYVNQENALACCAQKQQSFFYDVICPARSHLNAAFICGTNVAVRAAALDEIGGFPQESVTEDTAASILMHPRWRGLYVAKHLARGLGPMDFPAYFAQQRRWATGTLELLRRHGLSDLIFGKSGLTRAQRFQYLLAFSHYLCGIRDALFLTVLVFFLITGYSPFSAIATPALLWHLVPWLLVAWAGLYSCSVRFSFAFSARALELATFPIYLEALCAAVMKRRIQFAVTPKKTRSVPVWSLWPQTIVFCIGGSTLVYTYLHKIKDSGTVLNALWLLFFLVQISCVFRLQWRLTASLRKGNNQKVEPC